MGTTEEIHAVQNISYDSRRYKDRPIFKPGGSSVNYDDQGLRGSTLLW